MLIVISLKLDEIFKEKDKDIEIKVGNKFEKYIFKFSKFIEDIDLSSVDLGSVNVKIRIGVFLFDIKKKIIVWEVGKIVFGKFSIFKE